jgi:hypothetical protein
MKYNENTDTFDDDEVEVVKEVYYDKDLYVNIINNLFRMKKIDWCKEYDYRVDYENFILQRWLMRYDVIRVQVRWLDKYVHVLTKSMFISLAWSIIPKIDINERLPMFDNYKEDKKEDEYQFILKKIRKQFKLSDNDYNCLKERLINNIQKDIINWFSYYGVPKAYWKKYNLNFDLIKTFGQDRGLPQQGLEKWGF